VWTSLNLKDMKAALRLLDNLWDRTSIFADGLQASSDDLQAVVEIAYIEGIIDRSEHSAEVLTYTVADNGYSIDELKRRLVELKLLHNI
jgi:hypothetical protein